MAKQKINLGLIEGYDAMSAEDKLKAIEALEFDVPDDLSAELKLAKEQRDKYSSEIAERKRKEREAMDADAKAKAEFDEKYKDLESKYNDLLRRNTIAEYTAQFTRLGYGEELAKEKATAMAEGNMAKVISCEEKYRAEIDKKLKADFVRQTPPPDDKGGTKTYKTKAEIMQIRDAVERQQAIADNPALFGLQQ